MAEGAGDWAGGPEAHERSIGPWREVVGRVVVNAGHLELLVITMALGLNIPKPGRAVKAVLSECRKQLATAAVEPARRASLLAWITKAHVLIDDRNDVVHSAFLYQRQAHGVVPGRLLLRNYGTEPAQFRPQELERVEKLAADIAEWCRDAWDDIYSLLPEDQRPVRS